MVNIFDILQNNPDLEIKSPLFINGDVKYCLWVEDKNKKYIKFWKTNKPDDEQTYLYWCDCYGRLISSTDVLMSERPIIEPVQGTWEELSLRKTDPYINRYIRYLHPVYGVSVCYVTTRVDHNSYTYECLDLLHNEEFTKTFSVSMESFFVDRIESSFYKPFQKIIVFDEGISQWCVDVYSHFEPNNLIHYSQGGVELNIFVPYNDMTQSLLGTPDRCDDFYRFWEE